MVGHDNKGAKLIMAQSFAFSNRIHNAFRNFRVSQIGRAGAGCVQVLVHPDEGLTAGELTRRRIPWGRLPCRCQETNSHRCSG
jgi:hypothetical protein